MKTKIEDSEGFLKFRLSDASDKGIKKNRGRTINGIIAIFLIFLVLDYYQFRVINFIVDIDTDYIDSIWLIT